MQRNQLIIALFQRFCWLDEGLQARLRSHGWPDVSRSQSMVMTNVAAGTVRPSDIARSLGVSRQAIHMTIGQLAEKGIVRLDPDPQDRRHVVVALTERGARMREDAQQSMDALSAQIADAIGADRFAAMLDALEADWGENVGGAVASPRPAPPRG